VYGHEIGKKKFERYVAWLLNKGFEFACLYEVEKYLKGESNFKTCKIWLSLDDGWRSNLELIPVIEKYKIPLTIFISTYPVETGFYRDTLENSLTDFVPEKFKNNIKSLMDISESERWEIDVELYKRAKENMPREAINIDELRSLAKHPLISIGAHTHTHPMLTKCKTEKIIEEVVTNLNKLEHYIDTRPFSLAFPYGDYSAQVLKILKETQIKFFASIENGKMCEKNKSNLIPRNGIAQASFYENCCRMLDFWYPNVEQINLFRKK
jgi:peptidoglycan/xylan/chitin deacetylase (PgdA/CDA1 family)